MKNACVFLVLWALTAFGQPTFVSDPAITQLSPGSWQVTFQLSEAADVEVSIVNLEDSSVVRHLAAGLLGPNAPAPLISNSLSQSLAWDGKDNFGNAVAQPESLSARVRAGMSVKLVGFAGERLDLFTGSWRVNCGLVQGEHGSVYLQSQMNNCAIIRQYDSLGNYQRTVYPPPAGLPEDSVVSYGINVLPGGGWAPKTTFNHTPAITTSLLNNISAYLLPIGQPGELVVSDGMNIQVLSMGGACTGTTRPLITSPAPAAPPGYSALCGPRYFTLSHDPDVLYLSGWYYGSVPSSGYLVDACTTGFWADGQVFKVNRTTGVATSWIKLDSVPVNATERLAKLGGHANAIAAIHGVAIDDAYHVFVCDRLHNRVSVYDTSALLVGGVPVRNPDLVALSKRTGVLYVVTRSDANGLSLIKFSGWSGSAFPVDTVLLASSVDDWAGCPALVVTENGGSTNVWVGYDFGFRKYLDNGAGLILSQDFSNTQSLPMRFLAMDRVAVDPRTETLYWGGEHNYNFKITDWNNPVMAVCSTSSQYMFYRSGPKVPSALDNFTVGPNGNIYGANGYPIEAASGTPVRRYKPDFSAPLPYANTDSNAATCRIFFEASTNAGNNHRGMAVSWQGKIAVATYIESLYGHDNNAIFIFPDTGYEYPDSSFAGGTAIITNLGSWSSGVKFDAAGNVYVGTNIHGTDWSTVPGFETDVYSLGTHSGSVVKYAAGTTGSISGNAAVGAERVYPQPFGTYSGGDYSNCPCRNPRFDVDPFGRLYIPNAADHRVSVADNAGNTLAAFGSYGNIDSRGGLSGPGETCAEPAFPLGYPLSVAASEDYIYVGDYLNQRIVRVQKVYALDNIPNLTAHAAPAGKAADWKHLAMTSLPNPFNPESAIRVSMPAAGKVRLAVYNADGRLVREIAAGTYGPGLHSFTWRGENASGQKAAAGLYFYRLKAGNRVLTIKTVMAK